MSTLTRTGLLGRLTALITAGLLAMTVCVAFTSPASADDLNATSDDTLAEIEGAPWPEYGLGDADVDIAAAKLLLIHHGYDPHMDADRPIDFDAKMEASVNAYQVAGDLAETGRLDAETWLLLREQTFGEFGPGTSGPVVEAVQRLLNAKFAHHLATDGVYGPATEAAVRDAQEHFGIGVDGITGSYTFRALITYQDYDR
ncbi:peptidoglycan hydrolase-like protein with peptidoglycan-binding domain [Nocardiopsis sp. Huas11]|uniref:peptidoglycan-binding domain-containing protein n=1 Tax=Nocardiopsis sp. Huas11 TaxID=2183912 RepID=UPI000EB11D5E|nr:peptidoglycan-binding protein [Nocardiopsis sp. Huas11]RKS09797.1 peptidoglycan hydrolase-like protein with peptidoglycan-binding domain [Nocardiopsis sp. Huas11]